MDTLRIDIPEEKIADFCRRHHIQKLSLFGSVLSDDFNPDSDVDVLVEFEPGHVPGLGLIRIQDELSALLGGRQVDLVTPKFINPRIRKQIEAQARVQYAQGWLGVTGSHVGHEPEGSSPYRRHQPLHL